ncbi:MAG TPA: ATP-binding protein [Steroidobacteraceae bacterium]|nr:ATP-binding protein [Steroidobacteraceae bacterium]
MLRSFVGLAFLLPCLMSAADAQMVCMSFPDPALRRIQALVTQDAVKALKAARAQAMKAQGVAGSDPVYLASLYALEAQSYGMLELDAEARAAAWNGLQLVPQPSDPVHVSLVIADAENVYDDAGMKAALASVTAARGAQTAGSISDTCLLITVGLLQMRMNHPELAIHSLSQAYEASNRPGMTDQKVMAAGTLSSVMGLLGDDTQALQLNQELIDWATARNATLSLSISKFLRGKIYATMGKFTAAQEAFDDARRLSAQIDDHLGIAFADLNRCDARIATGEFDAARALCTSALRAFTVTESKDVIKEAKALLGRIELEQGHGEQAILLLNAALDQRGAGIYARRVPSVYLWRARSNAVLGRYREAYADVMESMRRYKESTDDERRLDAIAQRIKFETALKDQELVKVRAEVARARSEAARQAILRNLVGLSAVSMLVIAVLATWVWRRHKEIKSTRRAAEERVSAIGRITGGVAHEFNNMLTVVQQAAGLLVRRIGASGDATSAALVAEIQHAGKACAEITTQLLSFARQQNLHPEPISMDEFFRDNLSMLEKLAGSCVRVQLHVDRPAPVVRADRRQLTAALQNLVTNARDAMVDGGALSLRAVADCDRMVRIDVSDTGCGMTSEVLARATEPFYSTKPVGAGSGLGLSVVDGFATQSGGAMVIVSAWRRGTTVSLRLPRSEKSS